MSNAVAELFTRTDLDAERREIPAAAVIHEQHAPAENIFYIHRGQVRIYQVAADDSAILHWLEAGTKAASGAAKRLEAAESIATEIEQTLLDPTLLRAVSSAKVDALQVSRWNAALGDVGLAASEPVLVDVELGAHGRRAPGFCSR